jgi:hypothetical protein
MGIWEQIKLRELPWHNPLGFFCRGRSLTYFLTYLPIYIYRTYFVQMGYQGETRILTRLMFIHNRVIMDIHPVEGELVGAGSL